MRNEVPERWLYSPETRLRPIFSHEGRPQEAAMGRGSGVQPCPCGMRVRARESERCAAPLFIIILPALRGADLPQRPKFGSTRLTFRRSVQRYKTLTPFGTNTLATQLGLTFPRSFNSRGLPVELCRTRASRNRLNHADPRPLQFRTVRVYAYPSAALNVRVKK